MNLIFKKQRVRLSKSARKRMPKYERVTTDAVVRIAQPDDEDGIITLANLMNDEIGMFDFNEQKVRFHLRPLLHKNGGIIGVIGPKDNLEALIALKIGSNFYSDAELLEEAAVFVRPEYRNATISRLNKMIEFAKTTSDRLEMPLMIGVFSNHRTNAKVELYQKHFGEPVGAFFVYKKEGDLPDEIEATA